jgi:hypothetical protein
MPFTPAWFGKAVGFTLGWIVCAFALGFLNFLVSSSVDFLIAEKLGGVRDIPQDGSIFAGGQAFGGIAWTWSSLTGPLISVNGAFGMVTSFLLTGLFGWLVVWNMMREGGAPLGRYGWLLWANFAVWGLRFPVPIEYSLFYWTAIKY